MPDAETVLDVVGLVLGVPAVLLGVSDAQVNVAPGAHVRRTSAGTNLFSVGAGANECRAAADLAVAHDRFARSVSYADGVVSETCQHAACRQHGFSQGSSPARGRVGGKFCRPPSLLS